MRTRTNPNRNTDDENDSQTSVDNRTNTDETSQIDDLNDDSPDQDPLSTQQEIDTDERSGTTNTTGQNDDDSSIEENEFMSTTLAKFKELPNRPTNDRIKPLNWKQVHNPLYIPKELDELATDILDTTTTLDSPADILHIIEKLFPLSLLTLASGEKRKPAIIHSVASGKVNKTKLHLALTGTTTRASVIELRPNQLFRATMTPNIPTLEHFTSIIDPESSVSIAPTHRETRKISNTIVLPPKMAQVIMGLEDQSAENIYKHVLTHCIGTDRTVNPKYIRDEDTNTNTLAFDETRKHLTLLQHLYYFRSAPAARQVGFRLANSQAGDKFLAIMERHLQEGTLFIDYDEPPTPRTTNTNQHPQNPTNMTTQPDIDTRPAVSFESTISTTTQSLPPQIDTSNNTHLRFTGVPSPNLHQQQQQPTPVSRKVPADQQMHALQSALQNMTSNQSRFTHSMERLVNAHAKGFADQETKKIGSLVREVVLNASTTDGSHPAKELTNFAKDILSLPGDNPLTMIKILFAKNKINATPTPKFVAALRKGNLTYDGGIPDGFSLTQLPQSLHGTNAEKIDIARLMNMDENGTITEADTLSLNKSILPLSRTLHYLLDKLEAWAAILSATFGPESFPSLEAASWNVWLKENFRDLQEIKITRDPDLPLKIELAISDNFNRMFRAAMLGVPDESHFHPQLRENIAHRTAYLEIPSAVQDHLNKNNKRKQPNDNTPGATKRQRGTATKILHEGQPMELKLTPEQYKTHAIPFLQSNKAKLPKFDPNTDECMKFAYLGYCNNDCPRKAAHKKIQRSSERYNTMKQLRAKIMQTTNPQQAQQQTDFQPGEGS